MTHIRCSPLILLLCVHSLLYTHRLSISRDLSQTTVYMAQTGILWGSDTIRLIVKNWTYVHVWLVLTCRPIGPGGPGKPLAPSSPFCPNIPCWPLGPGSPSAPLGKKTKPLTVCFVICLCLLETFTTTSILLLFMVYFQIHIATMFAHISEIQ